MVNYRDIGLGALSAMIVGGFAWGVSYFGSNKYSKGYEAGKQAAIERIRENPIIERIEAIDGIDPTNPYFKGAAIKRLDGGICEGAILLPDGRTFLTRSGMKSEESSWDKSAEEYFKGKKENKLPEAKPKPGYFFPPPNPQIYSPATPPSIPSIAIPPEINQSPQSPSEKSGLEKKVIQNPSSKLPWNPTSPPYSPNRIPVPPEDIPPPKPSFPEQNQPPLVPVIPQNTIPIPPDGPVLTPTTPSQPALYRYPEQGNKLWRASQ